MTISRSQIERQLREGGGIMEVVPREEAFLGGIKKAIKKVTKAVKNVAKSPIGKAALFAGMSGIPFGGGKFFGSGSLFGKLSPAFSNLITAKGVGANKALSALKVGAATSAITGLLAAAEQGDEDAIEATTNVESLKKYLYSSYENLGYNPKEIPALVQRDVSEYTSGAGGYATGGRVRYQQGSGIGSLGGGSQTTPTTGKASYAEGPQLYRDLIDYLQIEGPKPEMMSPEMMMNDMGGGSGSSGGLMGPSGPITESSITSGSTGGGSGTGILQATPGTTQPTTTTPSNVAPTTTAAPPTTTTTSTQKKPVITSMYWNPALGGTFATSSLASEEDKLKEIEYLQHKDTEIYGSDEKKKKFLDAKLYEKDIEDIKAYLADLYKYNEGGRVGYASGTDKEGVRSIKPKKKPSAEKRILDMLDQNKQAAYNTLGPRNMFERMAKSAVEAYKNGEISKREFDRMIMPFFGRGGEMLTSKIDKEREYLDQVSMGKS